MHSRTHISVGQTANSVNTCSRKPEGKSCTDALAIECKLKVIGDNTRMKIKRDSIKSRRGDQVLYSMLTILKHLPPNQSYTLLADRHCLWDMTSIFNFWGFALFSVQARMGKFLK